MRVRARQAIAVGALGVAQALAWGSTCCLPAILAAPMARELDVPVGMAFAAFFAALHGAGNGVLTIAKGTLPLAIFGPDGYGFRQGLLMVPARFAQAGAPFLFALLMERYGASALLLTAHSAPPPSLSSSNPHRKWNTYETSHAARSRFTSCARPTLRA